MQRTTIALFAAVIVATSIVLAACAGSPPCGDEPVGLTDLGSDQNPAWSPDGSQIAFDSGRDGDRDIYVMNADGSDVRNLTDESSRNDWRPAWSPDGKRIAFVSDSDHDIYVMNADGSNITQLTDSGRNTYPAWSPNGRKIAFESSRGRTSDIYVMDADGSNQVNLTYNRTSTNYSEQHPSWTPDGRKIAFDTNRDSNFRSSYVMDADGSNVEQIPSSQRLKHPVFSPNGERVAFQYLRIGRFELNDDIVVMNADGSDVVRLTDTTSIDAVPAWSPGGKCIAISSQYGRRSQIVVVPANPPR